MTLDLGAGRELLVGHGLAGEALAMDADVEGSEVLQHHALTCEERLLDLGLEGGEDGYGVGLGDGGTLSDVVCHVVEVIVAGLDVLAAEVVLALSVLGVLTF